MSRIYVSKEINAQVSDYLKHLGHELIFVNNEGTVMNSLSTHPDMFMCKMGVDPCSEIFIGDAKCLRIKYPKDVIYNAACTGKYFLHNLACTDEKLLSLAKAKNMTLINVRQGYTKCSTVIVDENSIITFDKAISIPAIAAGMDVLLVNQGQICLPGLNTGFIGGTSGRVSDTLIFHGCLPKHRNFSEIVNFIEKKGLKCKWFSDFPLTDIGSIIEGGTI